MQRQRDPDNKRGIITPENIEEAARLRTIWDRMLPTLKAEGHGTQAKFGAMFGIGSQQAMTGFLNAGTPLSPKAARGFAAGLKCKVSEFSPRLAALLHEEEVRVAPPQPDRALEFPSVELSVSCIARALYGAPDNVRAQIGKELSLLADVPDSQTLVNRIATALAPFSAFPAARADRGERTDVPLFASLIGRRLEGIADAAERERLFIMLESMIDRETMARSASATQASTHERPPTRSQSPHR